MSLFGRLDAGLGKFYHFIGSLIGICIGGFALAIVIDLMMRLMKLGNLPGVQEIIEYILFVCVFLGAPWVLRMGAHIRVDLFVSAMSEQTSKRMAKALDLFGCLVALVLVVFGTQNLKDAYAFQSLQMKYYNVPEWWLLSIFVISFSLIAIEFLARVLRGPLPADGADTEAGTF